MLYIFYVECHDKITRSKRYNAYSVVVTHGKQPRVAFAFARQPWAIKSTTLTALRSCNIRNGEYIHLDIGITPTFLRHYNIQNSKYIHWNFGITPTALHNYNIHNNKNIHWNIDITPMVIHDDNIAVLILLIINDKMIWYE